MAFAAKILVLGGVLNIAYGLMTGIPAGIIRQNNPSYSKYLRFAHIGALMWGPILISLALAVELSPLGARVELIAAGLMVFASVALGAKDTMNWLMRVEDEFVQMPRLPIALGGLSALAGMIGIAIFIVGVIQGL
jgi:hypothetical protein